MNQKNKYELLKHIKISKEKHIPIFPILGLNDLPLNIYTDVE